MSWACSWSFSIFFFAKYLYVKYAHTNGTAKENVAIKKEKKAFPFIADAKGVVISGLNTKANIAAKVGLVCLTDDGGAAFCTLVEVCLVFALPEDTRTVPLLEILKPPLEVLLVRLPPFQIACSDFVFDDPHLGQSYFAIHTPSYCFIKA